MEFIDLNISDRGEPLGLRRVEKFTLDLPDDAASYEELLNNEEVKIVTEQFSYDRAGRAVITVWWIEPSEKNL